MPPDDDERSTAFSPRAFRRSLRRAGITATQHRVAVELCEYAGQDKSVVWPSIALLAEDCEITERSVVRVLNQLAADGFIVCQDGRKGGRGWSTRWRLIVKGDIGVTLSGGKRVTSVAGRVTSAVVKGDTNVTRSSKEEGEEGGAADAAHDTPPLVSLDGRPKDCCPEHEPDGVEECEACHRAWRKGENWESGRPQSWDEYAAEMLHGFPAQWMANGPPRLCERGHPVGASCGTCGELRDARKQWVKIRAMYDEDRVDRRKDISDCRMCGITGRVWIGDDPDPWWCDHGWLEPPLISFGTVSSVPPVNGKAVPDCMATEHWKADGIDTAAPLRAASEEA